MIRMKGDIIKQLNLLYPDVSFRIKYKNEIKERILFFVETKIDKEATFFEKMKQISEYIVIENTEVKQIKKEFINKYKLELFNSFNPHWLNKKRTKTIKEEIKEKVINIEEEDNNDYSLLIINLFLEKLLIYGNKDKNIIEDFFKQELKYKIFNKNNFKKEEIKLKVFTQTDLYKKLDFLKEITINEFDFKKKEVAKAIYLYEAIDCLENYLEKRLYSERYYIPIIQYKESFFINKEYIQIGKQNSLDKTDGKNIFREGKENLFIIGEFKRDLATNKLKEKLDEINEEKTIIEQMIKATKLIKSSIENEKEVNIKLLYFNLDRINTKYHW